MICFWVVFSFGYSSFSSCRVFSLMFTSFLGLSLVYFGFCINCGYFVYYLRFVVFVYNNSGFLFTKLWFITKNTKLHVFYFFYILLLFLHNKLKSV